MFGLRNKERSQNKDRNENPRFFERLVVRAFQPMMRGQLTTTLSDGRRYLFGREAGGLKANIFVKRAAFFRKCVLYGDIGFGESYVDGDWETDDIVKVIEWMILNVEMHPTLMAQEPKRIKGNILKILNKTAFLLRPNSLKGSQKNIFDHYDLGNDFFKIFLDPTMTYSSAYFKYSGQSLQEAQESKYEELCRYLHLSQHDHVLEIGSGWGGFAIHAAKNYGCRVKTITISQEQYHYVREKIYNEKLAERINIELLDYRLLRGRFDKVISIEMIEAVGHQYLETYFRKCHQLLEENGLLALQVILSPDHRYESFKKNVDWIQKYIFPGSLLPSFDSIHRMIRRTGTLCLYHYLDLTSDYAKTLRIWRETFNKNLAKARALGFNNQFIRQWNYYLSYCEAAFAMRNISVAQAVFTRPNNISLARF